MRLFRGAKTTFEKIGSRGRTKRGTRLDIEKSIRLFYFSTPPLLNASLGQRLRFIRRKIGASPAVLAKQSGISPNALLRIDFASRLKNLRLRRGLQQRELAKILQVSKVTICRYESRNFKPRPVIWGRLQKAFNLNKECKKMALQKLLY